MSNSDWGVALVVTVLVLIILFILLWDRGLYTEFTEGTAQALMSRS